MATKHVYLTDLHVNFKLWENEVVFFQQEIGIYEGYLSEVASKWTDKEVMSELEHFQNQFIIQKNQADILAHDIKIFQENMANYAKDNQTAIEHKHFDMKADDLEEMADRIETYKKIYSDLKKSFKQFLSKFM